MQASACDDSGFFDWTKKIQFAKSNLCTYNHLVRDVV